LFYIDNAKLIDSVLDDLRFVYGLSAQFAFNRSGVETFSMVDDEDFFSERADQSEVKARIVTKYFPSWAKIIAPHSGKVAYVDLFCGPGRYKDGSASTPLMLLSAALEDPKLRGSLVSIFNDADENHTDTLRTEIAKLPNIGTLKYRPQINSGSVDGSAAEFFEKTKLIPTFSFIDPFGYKGLSWSLIGAVIKDWASECIFFFNYSRINSGVSNDKVLNHMQALFGDKNLVALQKKLENHRVKRESRGFCEVAWHRG
jgi:three-Cys-motif partner protein